MLFTIFFSHMIFFFFFSFRETKNYLCIWLPVFLFPYNFSSRMYPGCLSLSLVMVRHVRGICSGPPLVGPPTLPSPARCSSPLVHAATCALPAVITLTGVFPSLLNEILVDAMDDFRELLRKGGWWVNVDTPWNVFSLLSFLSNSLAGFGILG